MNQRGDELFVRRSGQGPTLVLLHGWGFHSGVWRDLEQTLASAWTVVTIDLPGHGRSPVWPRVQIAPLLQALLCAVPEPAHWLGWSLGATLVLLLAQRNSARVRRVVLVGATPCFTARENWSCGADPVVMQEFAARLSTNPAQTLRRFVATQGGGPRDAGALRELGALLFAQGTPQADALAPTLALLGEIDLRNDLPGLSQRSLVIHGGYDRIVPFAAAQVLAARLPAAHLRRYDTGHAPFLVEGADFAATVDGFLRAS